MLVAVVMNNSPSRSMLLSLLLLATISSELVYAWPSLALNDLSPPPGNSLQLKLATRNGRQTFCCSEGQWKLLNATAELVKAANNSVLVGSYFYHHRSPYTGGTWSLINSRAEYAETGLSRSDVSATKITYEESGANILAEASAHKHSGRASTISYVQSRSLKVDHLSGKYCTVGSGERTVPYGAEYWLWSQDRVPPVDTPDELQVSQERLVEGFFGKGIVLHVYNGTAWVGREWKANLYDVPGGVLVGQHTKSSNDDLLWEFFNPNGFGIAGSNSDGAVQVAENCMPWMLNHVTSSWGNASLVGAFSHVLMVSTRGGMPPSLINTKAVSSPLQPVTPRPALGQVYNSTFSAIFWLYARS